jgi:hypothetical protein
MHIHVTLTKKEDVIKLTKVFKIPCDAEKFYKDIQNKTVLK